MMGGLNQAAVGSSAVPVAMAAKPRVLFVSPVSEVKGGAERVLLEVVANPDVSPVMAVPEPGELSAAAGERAVPVAFYHPTALVSVHRPPRLREIAAAAIDALRCAVRIRTIARQYACDIVHTNGLKADALGVILHVLFGMRVLVHLHDIPYTRMERLIWRFIGALVSRIIVVSPQCWPGQLGRKVVVLPNPVRPIRRTIEPPRLLRKVRLGFVGRYHPHKGLDLLLDWVSAARSAGIDASTVMRGRPDIDHPDYWSRICGRIAAEGLAGSLVDEGWRPRSALYDDIDFLLVPSDIPDPAPLVIAEAMSAGVVVIAYPAGGIPQLVPEGTGLLVRTPDEFVAGLLSCINDPARYERIRAAAYAHMRTAHDPDLLAHRFVAICQSMLTNVPRILQVAPEIVRS